MSWPGAPATLAELHEPLLTFIGELAMTGARTASTVYGTRGWTAHHNSDLWRHSGMVGDWGAGDPVWAAWPMGGPCWPLSREAAGRWRPSMTDPHSPRSWTSATTTAIARCR